MTSSGSVSGSGEDAAACAAASQELARNNLGGLLRQLSATGTIPAIALGVPIGEYQPVVSVGASAALRSSIVELNSAVSELVSGGKFMDWTDAQVQSLSSAYERLEDACAALGATFSTATTTAGIEESALAELCAQYCGQLKAVQDLEPCTDESSCNEQVAQVQAAWDDVQAGAASAGLVLDQMPAFSYQVPELIEALQEYSTDQPCDGMQPDGGGPALLCGITVLNLKTDLGLLALTLERF